MAVTHKFPTIPINPQSPRIIVWRPNPPLETQIITLAIDELEASELIEIQGWEDGVIYHLDPEGMIVVGSSRLVLHESYGSE